MLFSSITSRDDSASHGVIDNSVKAWVNHPMPWIVIAIVIGLCGVFLGWTSLRDRDRNRQDVQQLRNEMLASASMLNSRITSDRAELTSLIVDSRNTMLSTFDSYKRDDTIRENDTKYVFQKHLNHLRDVEIEVGTLTKLCRSTP